jgi:hypothetical protein
MKSIWRILAVLLILSPAVPVVSCGQKTVQTGLLEGGVTIGPISPVEVPGQIIVVSPEFFTSRKVQVYDASGNKLLREVPIQQIKQTANGYYSIQIEPGNYTIDITHTGIGGGANLPAKITITAGLTIVLDIDIDTGIR